MKHHDLELIGTLRISGSLVIPFGTTEERPTNPEQGSLRYNTTTGANEVYVEGEQSGWYSLAPTGSVGTDDGSGGGGVINPGVTEGPIDYLIVAGGGAGGSYAGGGGGAGGYRTGAIPENNAISGSRIIAIVGAGGAVITSTSDTGTGSSTTIAGNNVPAISAVGGGGGSDSQLKDAQNGGSGGGGARYRESPGIGTVGQGNDGGTANISAGGGGGASSSGRPSLGPSSGGNGGAGAQSSITGTEVWRAGGGGGAAWNSSGAYGGLGGIGGGGKGSTSETSTFATSGEQGTGGGGGGGGYQTTDPGKPGGSGTVILAYPSSSMNCNGGITSITSTGEKCHQFYTSGNFDIGSTGDFKVIESGLTVHLDASNLLSKGVERWEDLTGNNRGGDRFGVPRTNNTYNTFVDYTTYIAGSSSGIVGDLPRSVEIWYRADNTSTYPFSLGDQNTSTPTHWSLYITSTTVRILFDVGGSRSTTLLVDSPTDFISTDWMHVVVTYDGNSLSIYRNSVLEATTTPTPTFNTSDGYRLGNNANASSLALNGAIGQFRIYSRALTQSEVTHNFKATKTNYL